MSAPKGNRFWEQRSSHGRDKLFESPKLLWEAATEYFQWCDENPFKEEVLGSKNEIVELERMRPYTMQGLCRYLGCNTDYFKNFKNQERKDKDDFSPVITDIEQAVYEQKFSGAAAGFLNANIISRDLGLADKKEIENKGVATVTLDLGNGIPVQPTTGGQKLP